MGIREWAAKAPIATFSGDGGQVVLYRDRIKRSGEEHRLDGVTASVDVGGAIQERVTATRLALTGPLAIAWKKQKDARAIYLTVEGPDFAWLVETEPKKESDARKFAARVADAVKKDAASTD